MIEIAKDSTGNTATFQILDSDGIPDTGIAYNAAGLAVFYTPHGGTQVAITLSSENWHEKGNGWYEVDVADAVYTSVRVLDFGGVITDGHVIGERQSVVEDLYSEAGVQDAAAAAIADAGIATPSSVWSHAQRTLTSSAAEVAAALAGSAMTVLRGDTLTVSWAGLGDLSARSKLWVTGKADKNHPDNAALFQVDESSGLLTINGETAATAANASLVVTDEDAGDVTLTIAGVETAKLGELASGAWDLQILTTAGPQTITEGTLEVTLDVTRATS